MQQTHFHKVVGQTVLLDPALSLAGIKDRGLLQELQSHRPRVNRRGSPTQGGISSRVEEIISTHLGFKITLVDLEFTHPHLHEYLR